MPRYRAVVAGAALLVLASASTAAAHQGNANYRSLIGGVTPAVPGVKLQVLNFDDRLALQNTSGRTIVIRGYNREPYARVLADGTVRHHRARTPRAHPDAGLPLRAHLLLAAAPPDAGTEVSVEVDPALAAVVESLSETGTA